MGLCCKISSGDYRPIYHINMHEPPFEPYLHNCYKIPQRGYCVFCTLLPCACAVKLSVGITDLYTVSTSMKPLSNLICIFGAKPHRGGTDGETQLVGRDCYTINGRYALAVYYMKMHVMHVVTRVHYIILC